MAYVALNSFSSNEAASAFKRAMEEIGRHQGLLIDVRNNGGGSSAEGYSVISRLIDKPVRGSRWKTRQYMPAFRAWGEKEAWLEGQPSIIRPATGKPFLGPVVVLIGPDTVSAAEDFVVAIHAASRATLVGERTAGTTGQPLMVKLPRRRRSPDLHQMGQLSGRPRVRRHRRDSRRRGPSDRGVAGRRPRRRFGERPSGTGETHRQGFARCRSNGRSAELATGPEFNGQRWAAISQQSIKRPKPSMTPWLPPTPRRIGGPLMPTPTSSAGFFVASR